MCWDWIPNFCVESAPTLLGLAVCVDLRFLESKTGYPVDPLVWVVGSKVFRFPKLRISFQMGVPGEEENRSIQLPFEVRSTFIDGDLRVWVGKETLFPVFSLVSLRVGWVPVPLFHLMCCLFLFPPSFLCVFCYVTIKYKTIKIELMDRERSW